MSTRYHKCSNKPTWTSVYSIIYGTVYLSYFSKSRVGVDLIYQSRLSKCRPNIPIPISFGLVRKKCEIRTGKIVVERNKLSKCCDCAKSCVLWIPNAGFAIRKPGTTRPVQVEPHHVTMSECLKQITGCFVRRLVIHLRRIHVEYGTSAPMSA